MHKRHTQNITMFLNWKETCFNTSTLKQASPCNWEKLKVSLQDGTHSFKWNVCHIAITLFGVKKRVRVICQISCVKLCNHSYSLLMPFANDFGSVAPTHWSSRSWEQFQRLYWQCLTRAMMQFCLVAGGVVYEMLEARTCSTANALAIYVFPYWTGPPLCALRVTFGRCKWTKTRPEALETYLDDTGQAAIV